MTKQKTSKDRIHNHHIVEYLAQLWSQSTYLAQWEENLSAWIKWRKELGEFKEEVPQRDPKGLDRRSR